MSRKIFPTPHGLAAATVQTEIHEILYFAAWNHSFIQACGQSLLTSNRFKLSVYPEQQTRGDFTKWQVIRSSKEEVPVSAGYAALAAGYQVYLRVEDVKQDLVIAKMWFVHGAD